MLLSPDRLLAAFTREVIHRRPEEFKIACLKARDCVDVHVRRALTSSPQDIASLFEPNMSPFFAGFGNRETDAISYQSVGIPSVSVRLSTTRVAASDSTAVKSRTFIINPEGKVVTKHSTTYLVSSMGPGEEACMSLTRGFSHRRRMMSFASLSTKCFLQLVQRLRS
jgi:phosphatidate phosphatase PAH1